MSTTTDLADKVREKKENDLQEIESIQSDHVERLKQLLKDEHDIIARDTQAIRRLAKKNLKRSAKPLAAFYTAALIAVLICIAAGWYASHLKTEIEKQRATLDKVPNLHISKCGHHPERKCVEIKPNAPTFGKNGQWRIIKQ